MSGLGAHLIDEPDGRVLTRMLRELPDAVVVVDAAGDLRWGNTTAERLFDRSLGDSVGISGLEFVHPDDLHFVVLSLESIQAKEVGAPIEIRLRTSGGWRLVELVGSPVSWFGEGCVLLSLRDLTDRRRFELAHNQDARFRAVVQNAAVVTMLVSPHGTVTSCSGALTRILGHDPELVEGRPLAHLVADHDREVLAGALVHAGSGPSAPVTVTVDLLRRDGDPPVPFELAIVDLVDDPTVGGFIVTGHDVTDRKRLEEELKYQAFHDPLTGLGNRALFQNRLAHALERSERTQEQVAALFLDMDGLKDANDRLGHAVGDALLRSMASVLVGCIRKVDTAARLGGDEFGVIVEDFTHPGRCSRSPSASSTSADARWPSDRRRSRPRSASGSRSPSRASPSTNSCPTRTGRCTPPSTGARIATSSSRSGCSPPCSRSDPPPDRRGPRAAGPRLQPTSRSVPSSGWRTVATRCPRDRRPGGSPGGSVEYEILRPPPRRHRVLWILLVVVVVGAVGAGAYVLGTRHTSTSGPSAAGTVRTTGPVPVTRHLSVVSTVPADGATDVPSDQSVSVTLSAPVATTTALPVFSPVVAGTWKRSGTDAITFVASAPFVPTTHETLTVPAGATGLRSASGAVLAAPVVVSFGVAQASTERLQQLLAEQNYLPLSFTPASATTAPSETATAQPGTFAWRWTGLPADFTSLWTEGAENVITKAALMSFQNQNGLQVDGIAGPSVWTALLADASTGKVNGQPYTDVLVSKQVPESLTLYENGAPVMAGIAVNTGAPGADTVDGTFPVFEHVPSSRMQGTNPDGSTYDDPAVPWASFFNGGDALHGFVRATYGTPQSNGCVEMPIAVAAQVWPLTPIGTPVTVVGPAS